MQGIIEFANSFFSPFIELGGPCLMFILISLFSLALGVSLSKSLEGGLKLGIALTGVGAVIGMLTDNFAPALQAFVKSTGIELPIIDVGWAPLATITWGSAYTLYFLLVLIIVNIIMLSLNWTKTLDVDIFNFWHLSIIGLLVMYYSNNNLFLATILVIFLGVLKFFNSDVMKPTFNDLLDMPEANPTTTTHLNFMLNPAIMLIDRIIDKIFPFIDKYDFDAAELNDKIGFWGSKFAIGIYLGTVIGFLGIEDWGAAFANPEAIGQTFNSIFGLAFIGAAALEMFSIVGQWFIAAMEPLSQGVTDFMSKRFNDRQVYIGIDWPFVAARPEMWAAANVIAPIMLVIAVILPGNGILPLGGIIAIGLTPALLVVCRGKILRMILIGTLAVPIFLWSGTAIAPFVTNVAQSVGAMPSGIESGTLITHSTLEGPVEKFIGILVGQAGSGEVMAILYAILAMAAYSALFYWYYKQMQKRNEEYKRQAEAE